MTSLQSWLSALDTDDLAVTLGHRPDALGGVEPRGPAELAQRLAGGFSVADTLRQAHAPVFELLEALLVLGVPRRGALVDLLDDQHTGDPAEHGQQVDRVLGWLRARVIVWPGSADTLAYPPVLHELIPNPLGLGTPAGRLLGGVSAADLNAMLVKLGLPRQKTKQATLDAVVAALADGDQVRALVTAAPGAVAEELTQMALGASAEGSATGRDARQTAWERRRRAVQWAGERGLLQQIYWGSHAELPAEVARALRGPDYRAPFHPVAPTPHPHAVDPTAVARESAGAVTAFADRSVSVLDLLARSPVKGLKSGGVGARELTRLAKQTGATEPQLRLVLELTYEVGLLGLGAQVGVSDGFADWRSEEPAIRFAELLWSWWRMAGTPTQSRDEDDKPRPVGHRPGLCPACLTARQGLLGAAAELPPDTAADPADLVQAMLWTRPLAHLVTEAGEPAAVVEAEQMGVLAHGSLTELGRALVAGDVDAVGRLAADALPAATDRATFGSDLTVLVAGQPSARVSATLDAAADRESRGPATVWRFSPASVRRALDEGARPDALLADLQAVATAELPQPLRYLVNDVARRHGSVRVREAQTVLLADDEALGAQLAADRSLHSLDLRLVAPTVLLGGRDAIAAAATLRKAGYLPVREDEAGVRVLEGAQQPVPASAPHRVVGSRTRPVQRAAEPVDPAAAAARILAGDTADDVITSQSEALIAGHARRLGLPDVRLLAHAVDTDGAVTIDYVAATGGRTLRTVSDIQLFGGQIIAWCHLRTDERQFALDRIQSVSPAALP
ncbi:MAG: helicase-associated domain-containing protein [Nocardioidaceae bacterium]|nr:helicase-associated domain-containing protein [Nocardioidaceae bacterium]